MTKEQWEKLVDRLNSIGSDYDVSFEFKLIENGIELKQVDEEEQDLNHARITEAGEFMGKIMFQYEDETEVFDKVIKQKVFVSNAKAIFGLMYT